jgi:hypothetical protein
MLSVFARKSVFKASKRFHNKVSIKKYSYLYMNINHEFPAEEVFEVDKHKNMNHIN